MFLWVLEIKLKDLNQDEPISIYISNNSENDSNISNNNSNNYNNRY